MNWVLLTTLPQGSASRTLLARLHARVAVLRVVETEPSMGEFTGSSAVLPLREVTMLAGARHSVYDVVSALTLREVFEGFVSPGRRAPVGLVCTVVLSAARAVASIRPARAHGGLSDGSLLISRDGVTRVMDFGAPRLSRFALGLRPTAAGDVFALAAVLHSALTGFAGHYGDAVSDGVPLPVPSMVNPDVPQAVDALLSRALRRDVSSLSSLEVFAEELEAAAPEILSLGDVARLVGPLVESRHVWLEGVVAAIPGAAPLLGGSLEEELSERTRAHPVPWVTGRQTPEPTTEERTQPALRDDQRAELEAAFAATVIRAAPRAPVLEPDAEATTMAPQMAEATSVSAAHVGHSAEFEPGETLLDDGELGPPDDPTTIGLPPTAEGEWGRVGGATRRLPSRPQAETQAEPEASSATDSMAAIQGSRTGLLVGLVVLLVAVGAGGWFWWRGQSAVPEAPRLQHVDAGSVEEPSAEPAPEPESPQPAPGVAHEATNLDPEHLPSRRPPKKAPPTHKKPHR